MDENTTTDGGTAAGFDTDAAGALLNRLPGGGDRLLGGVSGPDLPDFDVPPPDETRPADTPAPAYPSWRPAPGAAVHPAPAGDPYPAPTYTPAPSHPADSYAADAPAYATYGAPPAPTTYSPPLTLPPPSAPTRPNWALPIVFFVFIAVIIIGAVSSQVSPGPAPAYTSAAPSYTPWSSPVGAGEPNYHSAISFGNILVYTSPLISEERLVAVNMDVPAVLWSDDHGTATVDRLYGDPTVVAARWSNREVTLYEPATGAVLAILTDPASTDPYIWLDWAGAGKVLTSDRDQLCMRAVGDPATCLWTAPSGYVSFDEYGRVFGNGRWVNTGVGVVDVQSGSPASFGRDSDSDHVFYTSTPDGRVFRGTQGAGSPRYTFQAWDPDKDMALSLVFPADFFYSDPDSPTVVAGVRHQDPATSTWTVVLTAYSPDTGEQFWQVATPGLPLPGLTGFYFGRFYWPGSAEKYGLTAYAPRTGAIVWEPPQFALAMLRGDELYAMDTWRLAWVQLDPVTGATIATLDAPPGTTGYDIFTTPYYVVGYTSQGTLWVLQR